MSKATGFSRLTATEALSPGMKKAAGAVRAANLGRLGVTFPGCLATKYGRPPALRFSPGIAEAAVRRFPGQQMADLPPDRG